MVAVESERSGIQRGVGHGDADRPGIGSLLIAPAIAECGILSSVGSATPAAPSRTTAAATAASTTTTSAAATAATKSAAASRAAASRAAAPTTGAAQTAAGIGAKPAVDAGRAESAHAQAVGAAETRARQAGAQHIQTAALSAARAAPAAALPHATGHVVGGRAETAADAAGDGEIAGRAAIGRGHADVAGRREILRAQFRGVDVHVLKALALSVLPAAGAALSRGLAVLRRLPGTALGVLRLLRAATALASAAASGTALRPRCGSGRCGSGRLGWFGGSGRRCGHRLGRLFSGLQRVAGRPGLSGARHLQGPFATAGFQRNGDLAAPRQETERGDFDFPHTGSEVERIPPVFVGEGDHFGAALAGSDGGARDELVGGSNRTGELAGGQQPGTQQDGSNRESAFHGDLYL